MNSTWILKLYPEPWRNRYEPEFRALLEDAPMGLMDLFDIAFGAIDAHIRPSTAGLVDSEMSPTPLPPTPEEEARHRVRNIKYLGIHAALFGMFSLLFIVINLLTSRSFYWAPLAIWSFAMPFALHTLLVFKWRGIFGALAVPLAVANIGLIGINVFFSSTYPWSLWTFSVSAIPIIGVGLVVFGITSPQRAFTISGILIAIVLVAASFYERSLLFTALFEVGVVISILFAVEKVRVGKWSLLGAHIFLFSSVNLMAFAMNLAVDSDTLWFQYVLAGSSLFLAVHAMVRFGLVEFYDSSWEQAKVAQLTSRIKESAVTDSVQRRILQTARIQRTLWAHIFFAVVVALDLTIINVLSGTDTPWVVWPVGIWVVILLTHAGYTFGPNRWLTANSVFWIGASIWFFFLDKWESASGGSWWFWPVAAYGLVVAAHAGWVFVRPRWYGAFLVLCIAGIAFLVIADMATESASWWYWPTIGIVVTVALVTPFAFNVIRKVSDWETRKVTAMTSKK